MVKRILASLVLALVLAAGSFAGFDQQPDLRLAAGQSCFTDLSGLQHLSYRWREADGRAGWHSAPDRPRLEHPGRYVVQLSVFGVPVREMVVEAVEPVRVYPGGEAIGLVWNTGRLTVGGYAPLQDETGRWRCPAAEAGLSPGDVLLSVNGDPVLSLKEAAALIDRAGREGGKVRLTVQRGKRIVKAAVEPVRCRTTSRWRVGLLLRDGAAGIGTLTFFDRATGRYAAVGHSVSGQDWSGEDGGYVLEARIEGIVPGRKGRPGEKVGLFLPRERLGSIDGSNRYGIFGALSRLPGPPGTPLPVALASQVHTGPCEVLTVVRGQKVEHFAAEILWVHPEAVQSGRGLILKITDPRLLSLAGGIVQGMSGSPIVQDGRLAGAVSHVFLNDPTRGFGVLAEWMIQAASFFMRLFLRNFFRVATGGLPCLFRSFRYLSLLPAGF